MPALPRLDVRYVRKAALGEGGMGEVFRGWDRQLDRAVALKFIRGGDARQAERLVLEARLQAAVLHPHVAQVYEAGLMEDRPCLALQLVDGPPLDRLAADLPLRTRVGLVAQAAEAIHAAHLQGLLHCDVKPGNILVETDAEGRTHAFVTDFGLARSLETTGESRTHAFAGTLRFMAPELFDGSAPRDVRADVYGLGATLYAVLALRPPFSADTGRAPSGTATTREEGPDLRRILTEDPTPLRQVDPTLPRDLERIVAMAMDKDPSRRYPSALAFAQDLTRHLEGRPVLARPEGPLGRGLRWARRNPLAARAVGFAGVVLAGSAAFALWNLQRTATATAQVARIGAEAKALESLVRVATLEPAHDLRPMLAEVRERMAQLGVSTRGMTAGPSAYALARGHLALEEWTSALAALHRAEAAGFHSEDLDLALAEAHLGCFESAQEAALREADPARREALLSRARAEHHAPALTRMRGRGALLMHARLALAEGRMEEARRLARAAQGPGAYEAHRLEGQVELRRQRLATLAGAFEEALGAGRAAREAFTRALTIGRSDRTSHLLLARAWELEGEALRNLQRPTGSALAQARASLEATLALDPTWGEALLHRADLEIEEGRGLFSDPRRAEAHFQAGLASARAAESQPGFELPAKTQQLWALANLEFVRSANGQDTRDLVTAGITLARAVLAVQPEAPDTHRRLATFLVSAADTQPGAQGIPLLREAVEHARMALRLDGTAFGPRATLAQCCAALGQALAMQDEDPTPLFQEGLEALAVAAAAKNLDAQQSFIQQARVIASFQMKVGRSPEPYLGRALDMVRGLLTAAPTEATLLLQGADLLLLRAAWKVEQRVDPLADLAEALAWHQRILPRMPRSALAHQGQGEALVLRATWRSLGTGDPRADLDAAERALERAASLNPDLVGTHALHARVHLVRATHQAKLGQSPLKEVAQGLEEAARVLKAQPGRLGIRQVEVELRLLAAEASPDRRPEDLDRVAAALTRFQEGGARPGQVEPLARRLRALRNPPA